MLEGKLEVKAGDAEAVAEVEGVRGVALAPGVETEGSAVRRAGMGDQPLQHGFAVAFRAGLFVGHQVIYVEGFAADEDLLDAEACYGYDAVFILQQCELVALRLLCADNGDKLVAQQLGSKLLHHVEAVGDVGVGFGEADSRHGRAYQPCAMRRWLMWAT